MKKLLFQFIFISCFVLITIKGKCQDNSENSKWLECISQGLQVGFDYAWYKNSVGNYNLGNAELFIGYSNSKKTLNTIDLNISLHGGIKIHKYYDGLNYIEPDEDTFYEFFEVDKFYRVFSHNKYYLELPITIGYTISDKYGFFVGYSCRYYFPQESSEEYDFIFDDKFENGILSGLSFKLSDRFLLNGSYVFALKNSYSSLLFLNGKEYSSTLKRRAFQINLQYNFKYF